jgi:hypothetical protein
MLRGAGPAPVRAARSNPASVPTARGACIVDQVLVAGNAPELEGVCPRRRVTSRVELEQAAVVGEPGSQPSFVLLLFAGLSACLDSLITGLDSCDTLKD